MLQNEMYKVQKSKEFLFFRGVVDKDDGPQVSAFANFFGVISETFTMNHAF